MSESPQQSDAELIGELYDGLVRFAAVVAHTDDDPDDLVHDALVRTMSRKSLADLEQPNAYLRRAILNLASNRRRTLSRRLRAVSRLTPRESVEDVYPSDVAALLDLTPQTRAVLWTADIEGRSFEDIALALGVSSSSVRQRASRGRKEIRTRIVRGDFHEPLDIEGADP